MTKGSAMIRLERWNLMAGMALAALLTGCGSQPKGESTSQTSAEKSSSNAASAEATKAGSANGGEPFVLGVAGPFTGNSSEFGAQIKMGVELYAEELNAKGGINGRQVKLNIQDDGG